MSEMEQKVKNNPTSFAKESEFTARLYSYSITRSKSDKSAFVAPKREQDFQYGGIGGVPLLFDKQNRQVFVDNSDKHTLVVGSTGSKKSRLVAIPTVRILGAAGESMIISDPKAEIYQHTSGFLMEQGYNVVVLNLRDPNVGSAWNPFSIPYEWYLRGEIDRAYEFVNDIAVNLTTMGKSDKDPFWDNSAGSFFFGLALLLFKYCMEENLPASSVSIGNIIRLRNALCANAIPNSQNNVWWKYAKTDSFISSALIGTIETANETRGSILSVFDQKMRVLAIQPSLLSLLAHNTIDYSTLVKEPTAIYVVVPDEKTGCHGLISLFIKQSYEYLIYLAHQNKSHNSTFGLRINYILDEFSSLPTIADFPAMITAARSRSIRFNLFLQSKHQLRLRYGEEADTIMANCENWIFLTSREIDFLREISELCGDIANTQRKPILSTSELQRLDKQQGECLVLHGRNRPFISNLADIDDYEKRTTSAELHDLVSSETRRSWDEIDFLSKDVIAALLRKVGNNVQINEEKQNKQAQATPSKEQIDELIARIDKKIVEIQAAEDPSSSRPNERMNKE